MKRLKNKNYVQRQNIEEEKKWHERRFYIDSGHWTSHPLFASRERHWLHYQIQSIRFYSELFDYVKVKSYKENARILLAPVGNGNEYLYLQQVFKGVAEIHGIDVSPIALDSCPKPIITKESDILFSGYEDEAFDVIVCSQFLHHVHAVGFDPFIMEFCRLLRMGGTLAILEPSRLYPFGWATALARKMMGNVTGLVEHERPISPQLLTNTLLKLGFEKIRIRGLLFTHARFPYFIQHVIDAIDYPFRAFPLFKLSAFSVGWFCSKP